MSLHTATTSRLPIHHWWQSLPSLLKSQLFVLLALWVPISIPLTCQIHGLMLYTPPDTKPHHQMTMEMSDAMIHMEDTATGQQQIVPVHRTLANNMLLMQLIIIAAPAIALITIVMGREKLRLHEDIYPPPRTIPPPLPPPRMVFT